MCHVLIIEDDWLLADHMAQLVFAAGATSVAMAADEEDAVASARTSPPAVIMSDVNLRSGTGPAAVDRIVAICDGVQVMFVTGEPRASYPAGGRWPVLDKPFDDRKLVATFQSLAP